tara:strand:+ start:379 stop:879 length:501 start_codon:yes stop_codon:yes gene_type:complete
LNKNIFGVKMRITESKLREVIRSVLKESWREHSKIDSIKYGEPSLKIINNKNKNWCLPEEHTFSLSEEGKRAVNRFKENPDYWDPFYDRTRFYMAMLNHGPNWQLEVDEYFPKLKKEDFQLVIEKIDGKVDKEFVNEILKMESYSGYKDDPNATVADIDEDEKIER